MAQDSNTSSRELMIKWLGEVIRREVSKPDGEADMELVKECEETLLYLTDSVSYTETELKEKAMHIISGDVKHLDSSRKVRPRILRRAAIAACVAVLLLGSLTITAYAFVPSFQKYVKQVIGLQNGSEIDSDGITFQYLGDAKLYDSIVDLMTTEELSGILLPNDLPDEIRVVKVILSQVDEQTQVNIKFIDDNISMDILDDSGVDLSELSDTAEIKEINGTLSYITDDEGIFTSVTVYNGYIYYIASDAKDKVITILESTF